MFSEHQGRIQNLINRAPLPKGTDRNVGKADMWVTKILLWPDPMRMLENFGRVPQDKNNHFRNGMVLAQGLPLFESKAQNIFVGSLVSPPQNTAAFLPLGFSQNPNLPGARQVAARLWGHGHSASPGRTLPSLIDLDGSLHSALSTLHRTSSTSFSAMVARYWRVGLLLPNPEEGRGACASIKSAGYQSTL